MEYARSLLEQYTRVPLIYDAKNLLNRVVIHNRVQGSSGLEKAIKEVAEYLTALGLEVLTFEVSTDSSKGFIETPTSWEAIDGFVELRHGSSRLARLNYADHPTLIAAHSPPGSGCGELKLCKEVAGCAGDVVLIEAPGYIAYKEIAANLVILYDSSRYLNGVPYTGLFIKSSETEGACVVNIPYYTALKLISSMSKGVQVEVCWKVDTKYLSRPMHGLLAYEGNEPGVLYISHICHPKPGAHDNASGVITNALVAKLLKNSRSKVSHAHLFVPEYTGTVFAYEYLPWIPVTVINLDMVGSKQWITNSTLNIVNTPVFARSLSPSYTYIATKLVLDILNSPGGVKLPTLRYSIMPFTSGSDHDVTLMWGLDSTMLNEWPSKYYHTDMDDVDTLSPLQIVNAAMIVSLAGSMATSNYRGDMVMELFKSFVKSWYAVESFKVGLDVSRISKVLENQVELRKDVEYTPLTSRYIYRKLGVSTYLRLRGIPGALTYLSVYAPLAYINNVNDSLELFQLENIMRLSDEEKSLINEAWIRIREELG